MEQHGEQRVVPPMPGRPPETPGRVPLADWLRMPRPEDAPLGVWRAGYEPRPDEEPERTPNKQLAVGAGLSFFAGWLLWSFLWNGFLGPYWLWPLFALTPNEWRGTMTIVVATYVYYGLVAVLLIGFFGRLGNWVEAGRRVISWARRQRQPSGLVPRPRTPVPPLERDPASWAELRRDGAVQEAERLTQELQSGSASDVDHARIMQAWRLARGDAGRRATVSEEVQRRGAGAFPHGSGARDLPGRAGRHDLVLRQVRIGQATDKPRNPYPYRTAGLALDPSLLATGLLAVGPTGSGKTRRIVRPVVESLCLQALCGQASVVVVTDRSSECAPDVWFDAVLDASGGTSGSEAVLDLFGGSEDADEAGAIAAEALVGDLSASLPGGDIRAAATAMAQLIGPYRAIHGCWPGIGELRDLLDAGTPLEDLRAALESKELRGPLRELTSYMRQMNVASDVVALLSDRAALLDRPALAGLVSPEAGVTALDRLNKPVRVRVDLPEGVHTQAGRILARLVLGKLAVDVPRRRGGPWTCLVMDDATATITPQSLQSLQRLRSTGSGVVLALRALSEVPEHLRQQLVSIVGCRAVCAGVAPWDATHFAEAWGTEIVEDVSITDRQIHADEPMQKMMYGLKKLATGKDVTAQSVTKRSERRQRWPASDLATEVPGGHAVISVTSTDGTRSSPILVRLDE